MGAEFLLNPFRDFTIVQFGALQEKPSIGTSLENSRPGAQGFLAEPFGPVEATERRVTVPQDRRINDIRRHPRRRDAQDARQRYHFFRTVPRIFRRHDNRVGEEIVHRLHAGAGTMAPGGDLHRRGLTRKNRQPVSRRVPRQVDQDIDLVRPNLRGQFGIRQSPTGPPPVGGSLEPCRRLVAPGRGHIAIGFEILPVALQNDGGKCAGRGMIPEIAGNISDTQLAVGVGRVRVRLRARKKGVHETLGPSSARVLQFLETQRRIEVLQKNKIAVRFLIIGVDFQGSPESGFRVQTLALLAQYRPQAIIGLRILRLQPERAPRHFFCLRKAPSPHQQNAEIDVRLHVFLIETKRLAELRLRAVHIAQMQQDIREVTVKGWNAPPQGDGFAQKGDRLASAAVLIEQ